MNILIVCETPGKGYGAERVLEYLLEAWLKAGYQSQNPIRVLAPKGSSIYMYATGLGFKTIPFMGVNGRITGNLSAAIRMSRQKDLVLWADVIHAWTARSFELAWILRGRHTKIAFSGTLHDHPKAQFHGKGRKWLMKHAAGKMNTLACVSDAVKQAVIEAGYRCPLEVCHNGVPNCSQMPKKPLTEDTLQIAFMGMNDPKRKGFELVKAWIRQTEQAPYFWNLYGDVSPELEEEVSSLPQTKIRVWGHQAPQTIFSNNHILVHASTQFDPFPTVLLEAAESGTPCLASSLGGSPEIIIHEETGYLFDPNQLNMGLEYLDKLQKNQMLLTDLGSSSRRHFEISFTSHHMTKSYLNFWRKL